MEAGLVREGRVFALSLSAIRDQLGARWPAKQEQVWDTVERALVKSMPAPDLFFRVDDTTILAAIASTDAYEGQVRCADVLRSVLVFFLGRAADGELGISRVAGLVGGALTCEAIDPCAPRARAGSSETGATDDESVVEVRTPERWTPPLAGRRFEAPFQSERQGVIPMVLEVAPVWRLDQGAISAYAIRRRLPVRIETLTDADREQINHRVVDHLIPILEEYRREGGVFALIVPGSFSVVSAKRSRLQVLSRCADVADIMRQVVVLEIDGIGSGAPLGRIAETASMVKSYFHAVTVAVRDATEAQAALREYTFNGIALAGAAVEPRLSALVGAARRRTPNVVVHDVLSEDSAEPLRASGASHVTFRRHSETRQLRPGESVPVSLVPTPSALRAAG